MYEYIAGEIAELAPTYAVIEAAGVGYYLNISLQTYSEIENEQRVKLFTHYIVREDAQILYGFSTKSEREIFRLLISVSGVGGNTARMVLSTYSPRELQSIISTENAVLLKNVKGLGLKTAQKIIVDLNGKMSTLGGDAEVVAVAASNRVASEAVEALMMLGFSKQASEKSANAVAKENPSASVEDIIRMALKSM